MTTKVKVTACCDSDTEVEITRETGLNTSARSVLQDGDTWEGYVYDDVAVIVRERDKDIPTPIKTP